MKPTSFFFLFIQLLNPGLSIYFKYVEDLIDFNRPVKFMDSEKRLVRPLYTFLTVLAFVVGLMILSLTQPQTGVSNPEKIDLGNNSIPSGFSPDTNSSFDAVPDSKAGSINVERNGWIANIARGLYSLISGQNVRPPTISRSISQNQTLPDSNISTDPGNDTETPDTPETPVNKSQVSGNISTPETGFFSGILREFLSLFDLQGLGNNTTKEVEPPQKPDKDSSPDNAPSDNPDDGKQPDNGKQESNSNNNNFAGLDSLGNILPVVAILLILGGLYWAYRNDVDIRKLLEDILSRLKEFIISLPDIFQRLIVKSVNYVLDLLSKALDILNDVINAPLSFVHDLIDSFKAKKASTIKWIKGVREKGIFSSINSVFESKSDALEGIGLTWYFLKKRSGLSDRKDLTPVEIGEEAIARGLESNLVGEIVDAYRWEKFSPSGYPGDLKNSYWQEKIGDNDE